MGRNEPAPIKQKESHTREIAAFQVQEQREHRDAGGERKKSVFEEPAEGLSD